MNTTKLQQNMTAQYCFPDNNASCRKEVRTGPGYICLFIFLSCVSVCTVFLNLLVIISISHFKQLHTPTNLLILSLAVADLLMGLFVMPMNIMRLMDSCWYLGNVVCCINLIINCVSITASISNMVLIAVDRYIAVSDPLLYSTKITVCKTSLFIFGVWFYSLLYSIVYSYFNDQLLESQMSSRCHGECNFYIKYSWVIIDLVVIFVIPCAVIVVLYSIIFNVARRQAKAIRAVRNNASNRNRSQVPSSSETKAARTLGIVIFVYLALWIPFYLSSLSVQNVTSVSMVWIVFGWLIYINSSVNPLIYAIFYSWFRASTKHIISCTICLSSSSMFNLYKEYS